MLNLNVLHSLIVSTFFLILNKVPGNRSLYDPASETGSETAIGLTGLVGGLYDPVCNVSGATALIVV
jgi:hypothetical protein